MAGNLVTCTAGPTVVTDAPGLYRITYTPKFVSSRDGLENGIMRVTFIGIGKQPAAWEAYAAAYRATLCTTRRMAIVFDIERSSVPPPWLILKKWQLILEMRRYTTTRVPMVVIRTGSPMLAQLIQRIVKLGNQSSPFKITSSEAETAAAANAALTSHYTWLETQALTPRPPADKGAARARLGMAVCMLLVLAAIISPNLWREVTRAPLPTAGLPVRA